jgi:hypothetical protein
MKYDSAHCLEDVITYDRSRKNDVGWSDLQKQSVQLMPTVKYY